jgi:ribosomal protein S27E
MSPRTMTNEWPRTDRRFPNRSTDHFCKCPRCGRTDAVHTILFTIASDEVECRRCGVVWSDCGLKLLVDRRRNKDVPFRCEYVGLIPGTSEWDVDEKLKRGSADVDTYALPYIYCCSGRFTGILP